MRIALAQLDPLIGDIAGTMQSLLDVAQRAKQVGADLLVTTELIAIGGYPPRDLITRRHFVREQWLALQKLAQAMPLPALIGCVEPLEPGAGPDLANAILAMEGGKVVGSYHKRLLPTYDVFDEVRYFRPGDHPMIVTMAGRRIGLTICEDIWSHDFSGVRYGADPIGDLVGTCDLVVNVSASPYHNGKPGLRRRLVETVARRVGAPVVYCNQVGGQDELLFDGHSCVIGPDGTLFGDAPRWREDLAIADLKHALPKPAPIDPMEDLYQGLVLGIADYCTKTRQKRLVLGLSGGIDSALVATLAADALGHDQVTGILMPGPFSSPGSIDDAVALAEALRVHHVTIPVTALNDLALKELGPVFAGTSSGLAEENLQSRLRGTVVMAVANKLGAMALTTGNKSELATGYCTIYGDMNGGLAPIGDLFKTEVWQLSRWINQAAGRERIPLSSIEKPPSAELRANQTDQDSLPDYAILDRILKPYIEDEASAEQIIKVTGLDPALVRSTVRLVEVNEFKRRQAAPALRITRKAFGVGRRMPIARAF
mgnify:CR=1 FL=1